MGKELWHFHHRDWVRGAEIWWWSIYFFGTTWVRDIFQNQNWFLLSLFILKNTFLTERHRKPTHKIKKGLTSWVNYRTTRRNKFYRIIRNSSSCGILSSVCSQLIGTSSRGTLRVPDIFRYYLSCIISFRFCRLSLLNKLNWVFICAQHLCVWCCMREFPSRPRECLPACQFKLFIIPSSMKQHKTSLHRPFAFLSY